MKPKTKKETEDKDIPLNPEMPFRELLARIVRVKNPRKEEKES
jgi:hypothetical protein